MDGREVTKLKMDRRLIGRRGWISDEDLEAELARLPDAADKVMTSAQDEQSEGAPGEGAGSSSGANG
jgi:hypothetical protein